MQCRECGTDNLTGAESCVHCGKVLAIALDTVDSEVRSEMTYAQLETKSIGSVGSRDSLGSYGETGICTLCNGTADKGSLRTVREAVYCHECLPLVLAGTGEEAKASEEPRREPGGYIPIPPGPTLAPTGPTGPSPTPTSPTIGPTGPGFGPGSDGTTSSI